MKINMRRVISSLIVLFLVSTLNITTSDAQNASLLKTLTGHTDYVWCVAFGRDGKILAAGGEDDTVRFWDVETGAMTGMLKHDRRVVSLSFSPDGRTLATSDGVLRLWDVGTGTVIEEWPRERPAPDESDWTTSVAFSADGRTLADVGKTLRLWDMITGNRQIVPAEHAIWLYSVAFSPAGGTVATEGGNGTIGLWNVTTGALHTTLTRNAGASLPWGEGVAFSPDGRTLAGGGAGLHLWDVATGTLIDTLTGQHGGLVSSVTFSLDSRILVSGSQDKTIRLWDVATGTSIDTLTLHTGSVTSVAFSPDGGILASGSHDRRVLLWNFTSTTTPASPTFTPSTVADQTFEVGSPVSLTLPVATGGTPPYTYSVSALPAGLDFDASRQHISGTPTTATPATITTYTATDATGQTASLTFTITVTGTPAPDITFSPSEISDQTFTVGTVVSLTLPVATGGTPPYTYSVSALPAGLDFDASRQHISGTPTTVISAHPVTYTATDATGQTASLTFTITVQNVPSVTDLYMYWTDIETNKIQRANLDGTNVQDILIGFGRPTGITLDISRGKIYWTDRDGAGGHGIHRMNLDGTNVETLVVGEPFVGEQIALDISGGKMYWAAQSYKIQRANLDGTNVEDLVIGQELPRGIALDLSRGKMYWTDLGAGKIQRANLDGSNIEDVITGLDAPAYMVLDFNSGKLYWTDWVSGKIQRANFDGSNLEDIVIGLSNPVGIALDSLNSKMYWVEVGSDKIQRANLDGTNVETLVTGLRFPVGIALSTPQVPDGLRFSPSVIADQTFVVNEPIALLYLPLATGGTSPYTYTLDPVPTGLTFDAVLQALSGTPTTVGTTPTTYTAVDAIGAYGSLTFTITVTGDTPSNLDVNGDGVVNVLDLVLVAVFYGTRGTGLPADVNADGVVNVQDLIAVAAGVDAAGGLPLAAVEQALVIAAGQAGDIEAAAGAPLGFSTPQAILSGGVAYGNVSAAFADARRLAVGDVGLGKWLPVLEEMLHLLAEMGTIPENTALLPNYPNPFNPETWFPYQLAKAADVTLRIYDMRGVPVRELVLGHQSAGVYQSRGRAAYWDGKNASGELVASGVYFYTFTAGDFTATRKMLIRK